MNKVLARHSTEVEPADIIKDLLCDVELSTVNGALLFIAPDLDVDKINALLQQELGDINYIGCTVLAVHAKDKQHANHRDETAAMMLFVGDKSLKTRELKDFTDKTAKYFAFSTNDSELTTLLNEYSCMGGLAADDWTFDACAVFMNGKVMRSGTVAMEFPAFNFVVDAVSGWEPVEHGWTGTITHAVANEVFTISGLPAIEFYESIVQVPELFGAHPVKLDSSDALRAVLSFDNEKGSITFSYNINIGERVRITSAKRTDVLLSTEGMIRRNRAALVNAQYALVISCAARNQILANLAYKEFELLHASCKTGLAAYLYGEFVPMSDSTRMENQHIVLGAFN